MGKKSDLCRKASPTETQGNRKGWAVYPIGHRGRTDEPKKRNFSFLLQNTVFFPGSLTQASCFPRPASGKQPKILRVKQKKRHTRLVL